MATITIRQLDEHTKSRLRLRAARHGRSMEEEARDILRKAVTELATESASLSDAIRRRFARFGGLELKTTRRDAIRHIELGE